MTIAIHHCVLRIRRTSGWAWGASPDALLAAATRALPDLIAARLPAIATTLTAPVHVTRPIRIQITTTTRELAALSESSAAASGGLRAQIEAEVGRALEQVMARDASSEPGGDAPSEPSQPARAAPPDASPGASELPMSDAMFDSGMAVRRAVHFWARTEALASVFDRLDGRALSRLHDQLLPSGAPAIAARDELVTVVAELARGHSTAGGGDAAIDAAPIARLRARIAIAAAVLERAPETPAQQLRAAIDRVVPLLDPPVAASSTFAAGDDRTAIAPRAEPADASPPQAVHRPAAVSADRAAIASPAEPADGPPMQALRRPAAAGEVEIRSVLPFLLLPSLQHAGWLDAAGALLAVHDLEDASFALAAALAGKVLDPPERGWMRSREDRAIVAAFAGTDEPIAADQIAAAAARLAPVLGVLDDSLRAVLGEARRPTAPVILWRGACGWSALDSDGFAVLASAPTLALVLAALGGRLGALLVVPAASADPATLDGIDLANLQFVTDAPPTRGEPWRAFVGVDRRLWTNDTATPAGKLTAAVAGFEPLLALAAELTTELDARPAVARTPSAAIEVTATLAVTAALADLSARLFPDEPATPILALSRFRDLDACVRFEPDCLCVRIPLGRRHADLMRHGVLTTVARVPWLGGRCVDLGGA